VQQPFNDLVGPLSPAGINDEEALMPVPALLKIASLPAVKDHGNPVMRAAPIMGQQFQQGFPTGLQVHGVQNVQLGRLPNQIVAINNEVHGFVILKNIIIDYHRKILLSFHLIFVMVGLGYDILT
jgi:hypothetical protein